MTTLLLARHGQTEWNIAHRWQGDPPLNDAGREQARVLGAAVSLDPPDALYCSDLLRARETAEIIGEELGLDPCLDARLREIDVGEWVGLTTPELELRFPIGFQNYREGRAGWEQGESYETMIARVTAALHAIADAHPGERVLVVTHAGVICSTWLASGRRLADWQGTYNGDMQEVEVEDGEIRWVGLAQRVGEGDQSKPSIFWRV